jgi:hypothetical protein
MNDDTVTFVIRFRGGNIEIPVPSEEPSEIVAYFDHLIRLAAMNPYHPRGPQPPGATMVATTPQTPQERWKAQERLRDTIKDGDEQIAARRADIDNAARGRRYKEAVTKANELIKWAQATERAVAELDAQMTEDQKAKEQK